MSHGWTPSKDQDGQSSSPCPSRTPTPPHPTRPGRPAGPSPLGAPAAAAETCRHDSSKSKMRDSRLDSSLQRAPSSREPVSDALSPSRPAAVTTVSSALDRQQTGSTLRPSSTLPGSPLLALRPQGPMPLHLMQHRQQLLGLPVVMLRRQRRWPRQHLPRRLGQRRGHLPSCAACWASHAGGGAGPGHLGGHSPLPEARDGPTSRAKGLDTAERERL